MYCTEEWTNGTYLCCDRNVLIFFLICTLMSSSWLFNLDCLKNKLSHYRSSNFLTVCWTHFVVSFTKILTNIIFVFSAAKSLLLYQKCQKQQGKSKDFSELGSFSMEKSLFVLEFCGLKVNDTIRICSKLHSIKLLCRQPTDNIDWQVLSNK